MLGIKDIKPYIEKGLISENIHPDNPDVRIYNYTNECQFAKAWDDVTLKCRGLIINVATGEHLSNPFPKFFNYEEHIAKELPLPSETPIVTEKMDGSLGILYWLGDTPYIATRGSFTSDQATWATKYFRETFKGYYDIFQKDQTFLFEIIYPENKVVVDYNFSGLVLIGIRQTRTDDELFIILSPDHPLKNILKMPALITKQTNYTSLRALEAPNAEGFVLLYPKSKLRLKIKFEEYKRLHKIMTGLSAIGIWEALSQGKEIEITNVPDEFFNWFTAVTLDLKRKFEAIELTAKSDFSLLDTNSSRPFLADKIKKFMYPNIGFSMLDGKDYAPLIWKMIRPKGKQVFKVDEE